MISGSSTDGVYQSSCTVNNGWANGTYSVGFYGSDQAGNFFQFGGPSFTIAGSSAASPPSLLSSSAAAMPTVTVPFAAGLQVTPSGDQPASISTKVRCAKQACSIAATLYKSQPSSSSHLRGRDRGELTKRLVVATGGVTLGPGRTGRLVLKFTPIGRAQLAHVSDAHPIRGLRLVIDVRNGNSVTKSVSLRSSDAPLT
jgi:hypothetical protein